MGTQLNRLTALKVDRLQKRGRYGDGGGLWLQVNDGGSKQWLFRFKFHGRPRQMGLGPVHTVSLADARRKATEARQCLLGGEDPIEARNARASAARASAERIITFEQCALRLIASREDGWRHPKHRQQWVNTLATYAYPQFGALPVDAIDTGTVLKALEPIWTTKTETASRLRMRIEAVLDWAKARGYRNGENPARWRGHLDKLLPLRQQSKRVMHHPALPFAEIGNFMNDLRTGEGMAARALEFLILCAARTGEVIGAQWPEIDSNARLWSIPAIRMKSGREHRVPLSPAAMDILESLPREDCFVFPGHRKGRGLSNMAMLKHLARMNRSDVTVHGFRSTFRDWAAEMTAYPREVAEMALAHVVDDKTEAAYRRGDLFEKRRRLAEDWAGYCNHPNQASGTVTLVRAGSHG